MSKLEVDSCLEDVEIAEGLLNFYPVAIFILLPNGILLFRST